MSHHIKAYCIRDLLFKWHNEIDEPDLEAVLASAIIDGKLKVTDPLVDNAILDTEKDEEDFLQKHVAYGRCLLGNGEQIIFNHEYHRAIYELVEYGAASTVPEHILYDARIKLCIRKHDFLTWLQKTDRALPEFWFTANERAQNPTSKMRKMLASAKARMEDPKYQAEFRKTMEEIEARKDVPVLLHKWFKHDTWKRQEGLMLLAGLSPATLFGAEESMYGEELRKIRYLETLDGLEHDPSSGWAYEHKLSSYESLWDSGDHPDRASPGYFIDWALSKEMNPIWLKWAIDNRYYSPDTVAVGQEKEGGGKLGSAVSQLSEKSFLHIIGALCDLYWKEKYPNEPKLVQARIIDALIPAYEGFYGISERNLKTHLPKAIKAIRNE